MSDEKYNIKIKTLSPVHIGSGNELIGNFDYVHLPKENILAVIDNNKIMQYAQGQDERFIQMWVACIDEEKDIIKSLPQLSDASSAEIAKRIIDIDQHIPVSVKNSIKEQMHLGLHEPTIPGTSIKGSIRTALLNYLIKKNPYFASQPKNLGMMKGRFRNPKRADQLVTGNYFGKSKKSNRYGEHLPDPQMDILRFLHISDFHFSDNTVALRSHSVNQYRNGWDLKKGLNQYWECIPKGVAATGNIKIAKKEMKQVKEKKHITTRNLELLDIEQLFKIINDHTLHRLDAEIGFWDNEGEPEVIEQYLDHLEALESIIKGSDGTSCVLRMGAGSGWDYMTGGWLYGRDNNGDYILEDRTWKTIKGNLRNNKYDSKTIFPKTRKLIKGGLPMGFVELSITGK